MIVSKIDYSKLNERIVDQAFKSTFPTILSKEDTKRLINEKLERARLQHENLKKLVA